MKLPVAIWLTGVLCMGCSTTISASAAASALQRKNLKPTTTTTTTTTTKNSVTRRHLQITSQNTNNNNDNMEVWGIQSGPANGHSDAGGMVYDYERDEVILVGTTHDTQYFVGNSSGVDCFMATIALPSPTTELSATESNSAGEELTVEAAEEELGAWKFSALQRVSTPQAMDRCDLVATVKFGTGGTEGTMHDHTFVAGTMAVAFQNGNNQNQPTAVEPLLYEAELVHYETFDSGDKKTTRIETSPPLTLLSSPVEQEEDPSQQQQQPEQQQNDIIIPAAMTAHRHDLYIATIHRLLVVAQASSTAEPMMRIALGLAKFSATDNVDEPLLQDWSRTFATSILEVKSDGRPPAVTSGMFRDVPGLSASEQSHLEVQQEEIEQEIEQIEQEQEEYEEEQVMMDLHRHEYKNDGVLISALEVIETENLDDTYFLVAGSAPGTQESRGNAQNNQTMSSHPFMDTDHTFVGDWDGYVAKVHARTGTVLRPATEFSSQVYNTWSFRLQSQPKRDDYVQSICVPRFPPGVMSHINYYPSVAYVVGTTQGIVDGTQNGGAFIVQLDLQTMNILWKKQIPGMNVHGMACEVLVDVASHGTTTRADSKDLLYIAGEVHGPMKVPLVKGDTTTTVMTTAHGETDIWVAQLKASNGDINWVQQIGTEGQDQLAKNINNPAVSNGKQETNIGETGSGKGALVLDRHGHALVYGTSNSALARTATSGNRYRDIFVMRLHKDDGSYQSILPPQNTISTTTTSNNDNNIENQGSSSVNDNGSGGDDSATATTTASNNESKEEPPATQQNVNWVSIGLGLGIPFILGILILLATSGQRPASGTEVAYSPTSQQQQWPFPHDMDHDSSPRAQPPPEHFNVL